MLRTHGHIPLTLISRALIWLQDRIEGFSELFPTLSRSVHATVMLQLSLDPGINAVFQFLHGRQKKLHLCVTRRGVFPAWCMWSTHVQSRVFSRPDPRGCWNLARGREKGRSRSRINHPPYERAAVRGVANRRLTDRSSSACAPPPRLALQKAVKGEATATDVTGFRPHPFSTLPVPYTTPPRPLPPPNGCTWLSFALSCTCSAPFQNGSFNCSGWCLTWYIHLEIKR